jgi:zinc protease
MRAAFAVEHLTLANGLRVVLCPDPSAPVVGVAVNYGVGFRSESTGRSGFAHLFEHLMFQGSANLPRMAHFRVVQGSGGTFNGAAYLDYTDYYQKAPTNALERLLFLEADRMCQPLLTEQALRAQIDVIRAELSANVRNKPYGGFPWRQLPSVMFDKFANAHDGYGDIADLDAVTREDAVAFFEKYYAPSNAVLAVGGDVHPDVALRLIERHFAEIPTRPRPVAADLSEPDLASERFDSYVEPWATTGALALAWRVPDPIADLDGLLPYLVLASLLGGGRAARLTDRLGYRESLAEHVTCQVSFFSQPLEVRDPTALVVAVHLTAGISADGAKHATLAEIERVATTPPNPAEVDAAKASLLAHMLRGCDSIAGRILRAAILVQQRGDTDLLGSLPERVSSVSPAEVVAAAATLRPERMAGIEAVPGMS